MATNTIRSAVGNLPAATGTRAWFQLMPTPSLRFEGGDLVIKLGHDSNDWLIIHSAVFAAVSPVFAASSSARWEEQAKTDKIIHPGTGKEVAVRTLALAFVDGTYVLEGKEVTTYIEEPGTPRPRLFFKSALAAEGWPSFAQREFGKNSIPFSAKQAAKAFLIFFAMVYGVSLEVETIAGKPYAQRRLVEVCAYAEYYGCLEAIAPAVVKALSKKEDLWIRYDLQRRQYEMLYGKLRTESWAFLDGVEREWRALKKGKKGWKIWLEDASKEWVAALEEGLKQKEE